MSHVLLMLAPMANASILLWRAVTKAPALRTPVSEEIVLSPISIAAIPTHAPTTIVPMVHALIRLKTATTTMIVRRIIAIQEIASIRLLRIASTSVKE